MNDNLIDRSLLFWSFSLILGVPLLVIILGEWSDRLKKAHHPFTVVVKVIRAFLLPTLALWLILRQLLKIPDTALIVQLLASLLGVAILYTAILTLNILLSPDKKRYSWQIDVPNLSFQVIRALVVLALFAYLLARVWQVNLTNVLGALGVGSLVIALALQDTLSNLVSGFLLIIESPFKVGDWIQVGELQGEVIEINWRAVRIRDLNRDIIIIPNGNLGKETICNYSISDPTHALRLMMKFSYQERPHHIEKTLTSVALTIDGIVAYPKPQIEPKHYGNSCIDYEIKFFITDFARAEEIEGDFLKRVYYALRRQNFHLPFADKIEYKINELPREKGRTPAEIADFLQLLPIFARIERDSIDSLAHHSIIEEFGAGEEIVGTGEFERGFYLVRSGQVTLSVRDCQEETQEIAFLGAGDFFGETAFFPSEPSRVSVIAMTDLQVIQIAPEAIIDLIHRYPHFAHLISQFIEERKKAIYQVKSKKAENQTQLYRESA